MGAWSGERTEAACAWVEQTAYQWERGTDRLELEKGWALYGKMNATVGDQVQCQMKDKFQVENTSDSPLEFGRGKMFINTAHEV